MSHVIARLKKLWGECAVIWDGPGAGKVHHGIIWKHQIGVRQGADHHIARVLWGKSIADYAVFRLKIILQARSLLSPT